MPSKRIWISSLILVILLIALHVGANWLWRTTNVVVLGLDRIFHLVTSQVYDQILSGGLSLRTLFSALTWSDYYPPLVHMTIAAFYRLLGVSIDVAAMANSLFLAILLLAVYGIGARARGGPWTGLLAAAIVSLLPMVFSMSRYTYLDFPLAAMVAANVCLLLWSERFRRRGPALLYGLSLGLGLLVKWTFAVFAIGPLLVVLLPIPRPGVLAAARHALAAAIRDWRRLVVATLIGLAITAVWFLPNSAATAALPLGYWLVPLSWAIWTWTCAFTLQGIKDRRSSGVAGSVSQEISSGSNLLAALGLGAGVAASWYLTKIDFLGAFWLNAYGKSSGRSWGFGQYAQLLFGEQLGPLLAVLVVAALLGLAVARWRRTRSLRVWLALGVDGWALVVWVLVSFIAMSSQVSIIHSRYILPLLPPFGIALAVALARLPAVTFRRRVPRPVPAQDEDKTGHSAHILTVRALAIAAVLGVALVQFVALSFDGFDRLRAVPLFAQGYFIQQPASGRTDPGYWVAPDVLDYVEAHRDSDPVRLGILVNTQQVNSQEFIYLVYANYPHIQIQQLAELGRGKGLYARLFESDFLLIIDPPPHYARRPEARETLVRLLENQDDTFHRAYDLAKTYPLPDGTRLLLYERRLPPLRDADLASFQALMADLSAQIQPGDAVIATPPELADGLARFDDTAGSELDIYPLPPAAAGRRPLSGADLDWLARLAEGHGRLWIVLGDTQAADPAGTLAVWAAANLYPAGQAWYGPLQLRLYAPPASVGAAASAGQPHATEGTWSNGIRLPAYRLARQSVPAGQIIQLELDWQASEPIAARYKVFVHLLDSNGQVVAQHDGEPGAGLRPTDGWQPGEAISDRHGVPLPPAEQLPPGDYRLVAGLYPLTGGDRLQVCCPAGDSLLLAEVHVEGGVAHITPAQ